jgi:hypothetical protein
MTDERLEEIRKRNKNGRGTHPEDELLTYVDALRKERDDARQLADQITRRKIDWSKMDETAFNEIERQRAVLLARIEKLRGALDEIAENKDMTNLADCCVYKTCTPHFENGELLSHCKFQFGVMRGFNTCAGEASEALTADDAAAKGE